jgi:hypothetical protein
MATTNYNLVQVWQISKPKTFRALQDTYVAAKKAINSKGKKGFFGGDKEADARAQVLQCVGKTMVAMTQDGLISRPNDPTAKLRLELEIGQFSITFPNWPEEREYIESILDQVPR